jgi:hypothetical protein
VISWSFTGIQCTRISAYSLIGLLRRPSTPTALVRGDAAVPKGFGEAGGGCQVEATRREPPERCRETDARPTLPEIRELDINPPATIERAV